MNSKQLHILILCTAILITSCRFKPGFDDHELAFLSTYQPGDTLIYRSSQNEYDTSFIVDREVEESGIEYENIAGQNVKTHAVVWYRNKALRDPDGRSRLVALVKAEREGDTPLVLSYLNSDFFLNADPDSISRFDKGSMYVIKNTDPRLDPHFPMQLFWDKQYGLVKYVTVAGVEWKRVNLPGYWENQKE